LGPPPQRLCRALIQAKQAHLGTTGLPWDYMGTNGATLVAKSLRSNVISDG
jgi:hypothetical protein